MPEYLKEGFLRDLTRPIAVGERVNVHVIEAVQSPEPDYEAMRRLIASDLLTGRSARDDKAA